MWDVLAFGALAVDEICYVGGYPVPNSKNEVRATDRESGGLAGNVLVTVARMNLSAAYCGVFGNNELSRFSRAQLENEGVDCSACTTVEQAQPFHSFVIVDESTGSRTILYSSEGVTEPEPDTITSGLVENCRVLFVDHTASNAALRAARIARAAGIPVVADIERVENPAVDELLDISDHLIVGIDFGRAHTGRIAPEEVVDALEGASRRVVVVTAGEEGCWWRSTGGSVAHQKAFPVLTVDTLACGDVFHGAYAAAVAEGHIPAEAVLRATAAASLKAARRGGRSGIPRRHEVEALLNTRNP